MICSGCGEPHELEDVADHALCNWPDAAFTKNRIGALIDLEDDDETEKL